MSSSRRSFWATECLDLEDAEGFLERCPLGSYIEVRAFEAGNLYLVWIPINESVPFIEDAVTA